MYDNAMDKIENFIKESKNNKTKTPQNTVNSPTFMVWKFCGKAQFSHSMRKLCLSTKLRYFTQ